MARAFKADVVKGELMLLTRTGKRVDMRTNAGRRFRALVEAIVNDLGGPTDVTTAELQLIRRAAALSLDLEFMEAEALDESKAVDPDTYRVLAECLRKMFQTLGLRRRAREVGQIVTADEALNVIHTRYSTIEAKGDAAD